MHTLRTVAQIFPKRSERWSGLSPNIPMHESRDSMQDFTDLAYMYTNFNLLLVALSASNAVSSKPFHKFVGANTVVIAIVVLYIAIRTKWSVLPKIVEDIIALVFNYKAQETPSIPARMIDVFIHYVPLLLVTIPFATKYYIAAFSLFTIWCLIMIVTNRLESMYRPIPERILQEGWIVSFFILTAYILVQNKYIS